MRLPANLDRDYYREGIKYLVQFDKPFFVVGEYQLPSTPSEAIFSCFRRIFPVIYGAKSIMLCDHIHVARGLCEKYYGHFLIEDIGRKFLLCVRPYLYAGNRGGLEITKELSGYLPPIAPMVWYSGKKDIFQSVPYAKVLDFHFLPHMRSLYIKSIQTEEKVGFISRQNIRRDPKVSMKGQEQPHIVAYQRLVHKVQRIEALGSTRTGRKILYAEHHFPVHVEDKSAYLSWILTVLLDHHCTVEEGVGILSIISIGKKNFERLTGLSRKDWCQKYLSASSIIDDAPKV